MKNYMFDTIAAVATAVGSSGIGIIRISGSLSLPVLKNIFRQNLTKSVENFESHKMVYGFIVSKEEEIIDEVMAVYMKSPKTYTKEDVVEIHCHGGIKPLQGVLSRVLSEDVRMALPGEFTKRAFLNGRIDLSQAEAVIDIINSKTELSNKSALSQLRGSLSEKIKNIRFEILALIANVEASIDYPEHEMEFFNLTEIKDKSSVIIKELKKLINSANKGKIIKEGIDTVIIGSPNVGKSSLLNYLLDEQRAIVTDIAGTTRDVLQEYINIHDISLKITDTAGIRDTEDFIENIGVNKSKEYALNADLVLFMLDGSKELTQNEENIIKLIENKNKIVLINKTDLEQKLDLQKLYKVINSNDAIFISLLKDNSVSALYEKIREKVFDGEVFSSNEVLINNVRHKNALEKCVTYLENAINAINSGLFEDFVSIDLTESYNALGEITGETIDEGIIDKIFSSFCLGK